METSLSSATTRQESLVLIGLRVLIMRKIDELKVKRMSVSCYILSNYLQAHNVT